MHIIKIGLISALLITSACADTSALPFSEDDGCNQEPMRQFGQYIGDWSIEDSRLSRESGQWEPGKGARWIFACVGDGLAVQDFWMPTGGDVGTNLRTFNAQTGSWDIAWAAKSSPGFAHITAAQAESGEIVMHYQSPVQNPPRRITFYPADEQGWTWKLELSFDDGESWVEVYRIKARPYLP